MHPQFTQVGLRLNALKYASLVTNRELDDLATVVEEIRFASTGAPFGEQILACLLHAQHKLVVGNLYARNKRFNSAANTYMAAKHNSLEDYAHLLGLPGNSPQLWNTIAKCEQNRGIMYCQYVLNPLQINCEPNIGRWRELGRMDQLGLAFFITAAMHWHYGHGVTAMTNALAALEFELPKPYMHTAMQLMIDHKLPETPRGLRRIGLPGNLLTPDCLLV